jgi:uncharacterized phage-associated protein
MYSALDIAKIVLQNSDPEQGEVITNLKLQKLLYYIQGFHLAMYDKALFTEDILAWQYGPVVREVYDKYKDFKDGVINSPEAEDCIELKQEELDLINEVYEVYGQFSALKLMELTHNESPWKLQN